MSLSCQVVYNDEALEAGFSRRPSQQNYIYNYTERIEIFYRCEAELSKETALSSGLFEPLNAAVIRIIRMRGSSTTVVSSTEEELAGFKPVAKITESGISVENDKTQQTQIDLRPHREVFDKFAAENKDMSLTGELVVRFAFRVRDEGGIIYSVVDREMAIPFTSPTYNISITGRTVSEKSFPEREIRFPHIGATVAIILITAALIAGLTYSLKKLFMEKDGYKRELKAIFRKYGDEIVMAAASARLPDGVISDVKSFKELVKLSQIMFKPIVAIERESISIFYIQCDGTLYKYQPTVKDGK